jgi:hypothetical protein
MRAFLENSSTVKITNSTLIVYLGSAFEGYLWGVGSLSLVYRVVLSIGGLLTAFPNLMINVIGISILALSTLIGYRTVRAKKIA